MLVHPYWGSDLGYFKNFGELNNPLWGVDNSLLQRRDVHGLGRGRLSL